MLLSLKGFIMHSFKPLFCTDSGISEITKHFHREYCLFAQHLCLAKINSFKCFSLMLQLTAKLDSVLLKSAFKFFS